MANTGVKDEMLKVLIGMQKTAHKVSNSGPIPPAMFQLLHLIYHQAKSINIDGVELKGYEMSEFAKALKVSKPAISKVLKECENQGYCIKVTMPNDKRKSVVILCEKGIQLCQQIDEMFLRKVDEMIDELGEADTLEFIRIMTRLQDILNEMSKKGKKTYDEIKEIS